MTTPRHPLHPKAPTNHLKVFLAPLRMHCRFNNLKIWLLHVIQWKSELFESTAVLAFRCFHATFLGNLFYLHFVQPQTRGIITIAIANILAHLYLQTIMLMPINFSMQKLAILGAHNKIQIFHVVYTSFWSQYTLMNWPWTKRTKISLKTIILIVCCPLSAPARKMALFRNRSKQAELRCGGQEANPWTMT